MDSLIEYMDVSTSLWTFSVIRITIFRDVKLPSDCSSLLTAKALFTLSVLLIDYHLRYKPFSDFNKNYLPRFITGYL